MSAFSYSMVTTINRDDVVLGRNERADKELVSDMNDMDVSMFADGTYTSNVQYEIPYGYIEPMDVSVVLKDGVITEAEVSFAVVNPVSAEYQKLFAQAVQTKVVGQRITDVSLARAGGASLTSGGFNEALADIKSQASSMPMEKALPVSITLPSIPTVETSESIIESVAVDTTNEVTTYTIVHSYSINESLTEPMQTTLTVVDDVIVDVAVAFDSPDVVSQLHQEIFVDQYYDEIVGQPMETASLARVSYASLTTQAFNDALAAARAQPMDDEV